MSSDHQLALSPHTALKELLSKLAPLASSKTFDHSGWVGFLLGFLPTGLGWSYPTMHTHTHTHTHTHSHTHTYTHTHAHNMVMVHQPPTHAHASLPPPPLQAFWV